MCVCADCGAVRGERVYGLADTMDSKEHDGFAAVFMGGCCRICAAGQLVAVGDDSIFRRFCAALSDADAGTLHTSADGEK